MANNKSHRQIIQECIQDFFLKHPEYYKHLPVNIQSLNEMAISIKDYEDLVTSRAILLYNTACNIRCLEDISDSVQHWRHELIVWFADLLKPTIKKGIDKRPRLIKGLIEPCLNPVTYEADEPELFARAMRAELRKATRCTAEEAYRYQLEATYIQEYVMPNINSFWYANKERVGLLFQNAVDAICDADYEALIEAVDEFINNN